MSVDLDNKKSGFPRIHLPKIGGPPFGWNLLLLFGGMFAIVGAVALEHPLMGLLDSAKSYAATDPAQPSSFVARYQSSVLSWKTFIGILKEVGFALIIAWAVSVFIEQRSRAREHKTHEAQRRQMANDVVHAVFGLLHKPAYVRKVVETNLQTKVVRKHYDATYRLEALTPEEEAELEVEPGRFVKLTQRSTYTFLNVSPGPVKHKIVYSIAVRGGKIAEAAGLKFASLDKQELKPHQITKALNPNDEGWKVYEWEKTIPADGELPVVMQAVSYKELSDTEVWGSYHPTYHGMKLSVINLVPHIVKFGLRALTATPKELIHETPGEEAQWEISGPVLPNDSVTFWWRSIEDDGRASSTPKRRRRTDTSTSTVEPATPAPIKGP
ncbi:MAG: hypothetical protein IM674_12640 [Brevundimonas sp.]|nr:hypothetical protein [Brevundimonas sp.]